MASSLILFFLSVNLMPFTQAKGVYDVQSGSLTIRDVIPAGKLDVYQDYELVHLEERKGEDTVYITKRAPVTPTTPKTKQCDDCAWFTPWLEKYGPAAKRDVLDTIRLDDNATTHRLQARKTDKDVTDLCKSFALTDVEPLAFGPYNWPSNDDMEKKGMKKVYDFKPYDEPDQESYYELKLISDFQSRGGSTKAVSVEHILEWQVLLDFIRENKDRCQHFAQYFQIAVDIDTTLQVQSSPVKVTGKERAIDWVAHQYPGNDANGIANKFMYEFVNLHDDVNGRKMLLWSEPEAGKKKSELVNSKKMTKWLGGQYWTKTVTSVTDPATNKKKKIESNKLTKSDKNQGLCEAVVTLRDIVGVYKYHTYSAIQTILTAQIDRIATAFEYLENGPLKSAKYDDPTDPAKKLDYAPMATSLKAQWDAYMKAKYTRVIKDLEATMDSLAPKLQNAKVKRSLLSSEKRGAGDTRSDLCGEEADKTAMNKRIDMVIKAYKNKGTWKNPYA